MTTLTYGATMPPHLLLPGPLPPPRGPLTEALFEQLRKPAGPLFDVAATGNPLTDEDAGLALYCLYELHYRGFADVDEDWEWQPDALALRQDLETAALDYLHARIGPIEPPADIAQALRDLIGADDGEPSVSAYLLEEGTAEQMQEFLVQRTAFQLKEADPFTWAIPRLAGIAKAAMVEIQAEEYGDGREADVHQNLYGLTLASAGLQAGYHAYLPMLPATTLATVSVMSLFGLHRRWRGALVGHLALFEMTSVQAMGTTAAALRRLGYDATARHFFEVHVVADARHDLIAADKLAVGLVDAEPERAADILFGARAAKLVEADSAALMLAAWRAGRSSLLPGPAEQV